MATKRKLDDDKPVVHSADALRALLSSAITSYESAEVALLHICSLQQTLSKDHIDVSPSNAKYKDIAPLVGLNPYLDMNDIETFRLHRSRIPTGLFKSIVQDIDVMMVQYGPPIEHDTAQARSRFLSPIFSHLIPVFGFAFRNMPESPIEGRVTTKGRVEHYFTMIGFIAVLFIETMPEIGNRTERLDAVAQVIAECGACDRDNAQQGFHAPIYGILCDGYVFEFFLFDGTTKPVSFKYGLGANDAPTCRRHFQLPNPEYLSTTRPFIDALRPICETIFDLLLGGYVLSLKAHHNNSVNESTREGQPRKSSDNWEEAMSASVRASQYFRYAEAMRQTQLTNDANSIAEEAMGYLKHSVDAIPILHKPKLIMSGWDDEEIEK